MFRSVRELFITLQKSNFTLKDKLELDSMHEWDTFVRLNKASAWSYPRRLASIIYLYRSFTCVTQYAIIDCDRFVY